MRTGLIVTKIGMSRLFQASGESVPVTVLKVEDCTVVAQRTTEKNGYVALQLGAGEVKPQRLTKPMREYFAKAGVAPKKTLAEFRVSEDALLPVGEVLKPSHFEVGQKIDAVGTSIGKGFAGVMKRWNFGGMRASHGVSISHRAHGSTGQCQDPGRVFKGKKMAGHLGDHRTTVQNLEVVSVDDEKGLLFVKGAVPGSKNATLYVSDTVKNRNKRAA